MDSKKYIGMDVHQATISVAVMNEAGKVVMDSVIQTKASTIVEFIEGLRGSLWVTFEEGTSAAWLYDLLKPYVAKVVVFRARTRCSKRVTRMTALTPASWPICCELDSSRRSTTGSRA